MKINKILIPLPPPWLYSYTEPLPREVMEFTIMMDTSLFILTEYIYILSLSDLCPISEKNIVIEIYNPHPPPTPNISK